VPSLVAHVHDGRHLRLQRLLHGCQILPLTI
jgi:hypothetical protein